MEQAEHDESGCCVVCGRDSVFRFDATIITPQLKEAWGISDWLVDAFNRKESMFCDSCGSSLRVRRLAAVLVQTFAEISSPSCKSFAQLLENRKFLELKIAEINACGGLHSYLKAHPNLYYSEWLRRAGPGQVEDGVRCEDLQCLTYPDDYFDIVLTSETLEHVPDPDKAWSEIHRVLKAGGWHIFTIPIIPSQKATVTRAKLVNGNREAYLKLVYHGAWGDENMVVYTDFGMDLVEKLDGIGLNTEVLYQKTENDELDVAVVFRSRKLNENTSAASVGGSKMLEWTGERYLPWLEDPYISYEHLHRYAYVTQFVPNKKVLDLACGEGYGSRLLARTAESVVGVDIDEDTVRHARNKYIRSNLQFKQGSITDIPIEGRNLFDVIVCFEALEHIQDHEKLLNEVKRLLTKDGLFVVSTPNKWAYSDEPKYENPFHVRELYLDEFTELFEKYFKQIKILGQRIYCNSNIWPIFSRGNSQLAEYIVERNPREFAFVEGDKRIALYFIALASDAAKDIGQSASNLVDISNELLTQKDRAYAVARDNLENTIKAQQQALVEKEGQLGQFAAEREQYAQEVVKLGNVVQDQQRTLREKDRELWQVSAERQRQAVEELAPLRAVVEQKSQQLAEQELALLRIYQSHGWKLLALYYRFRNGLLPEGTRRRDFSKSIFHAALDVRKGFCFEGLGFWRLSRTLYHHLPLSQEAKQRLKSSFFSRTRLLTENTQAYKFWYDHQGQFLERVLQIASELNLPSSPSTPLVSIIIPVYNQIKFTLRCLKSIRENPSRASAEIIVLDDASQDETPEILPGISGIRYLRNQANMGFLRSCNRAASEARGEYLLFLNNDTEVQKEWLDQMLAVFEGDEHTGIVGAKLIYPNGRLQEAGSLIWSDGSARNFGRDDDPRKPEYNYVRETDYCSAACILIKARLFQDVNGFDEIFEPAYYEDVDLAFKVRDRGYKVLYQPAAQVTHFEGGTCGTDLSSGVKSYQQINAKKFSTKWSEMLSGHCSPEDRDLTLARDRRAVGRCLFLDVWLTPDRDAGSIYSIYLIKLFQHFGYQVTFFPGNTTQHFGKYTDDLQQMGIECLYEPFVTGVEEYLERNGRYFDIVVLCRAGQAIPYIDVVRLHCSHAKIIFHTVDLHFLREERAAHVRDSVEDLTRAQQLKKDELEVCARADCTLVPSMAEASLLAKEVPSAYVECIPFSASLPGRKQGFDARQDIVFVAGYLHEPNVDAVTYFVNEIWPHVAERLPEVQFLMVGSNMPQSVSSLANDRIKAIGYVEDLAQFLETCRLTVAPLRFGAGIKGKVITSLGLGVPVVASSLAVEGMGCEHGVHLLVADTIAEWTESVARIYTNEDLWEYLSDNGLALMRETYSLEAGIPRLQALLHRIGCPLPTDVAKREPSHSTSSSNGASGDKKITVIENPFADKLFQKTSTAEMDKVRAIAFYLPQYHPIPENDKWWGKGFTEWTYVARAKPLFPGHYQPQLPSELGFYDLRMAEVREAQADLAREYRIYGFCYHYYWFGGKRVLDRPLNEMLASGKPDFPFCLSWANENWTRRWDGREQEILLKQEYSDRWDGAFIQDILPALNDRRYIRVNGKPLLLVYRTESLPDAKKTAEIWREEAIRAGIGDLYLCRVESFATLDPENIGFDAACQFPPLLIGSAELDPLLVFNGTDASAFKGRMFDYQGLAQRALDSDACYKRFFGVTPSWDNTPRRGKYAYMWSNNSPGAYENWLAQAVKSTVSLYPAEERLIFVNAWNEWGEGCHLEPDQRYGRAFLEATRRALCAFDRTRVLECPVSAL